METAISSYVVQGYVLANKTQTSATMMKRKEFSVLWAVIGFLICIIPLLVYLIIYAGETDKVVEIRIVGGAGDDELAELERLAELRNKNVLTEEEYEVEKRRLLGPFPNESEPQGQTDV
jgi:hypothetical protein